MKNLPRLCKQVEQLSVVDHAAVCRARPRLFKEGVAEAQGIAKNDDCPAKALPSFLPQAEGHRGVCAPRGRGASYVALSPD